MAKFKISRWLDGINTRINKFRIQESEAVESIDTDISNLELKPQKGLDTGNTPSGDYNFKNTWEVDSSADKFTESGDYLIKSYPNQDAKFNRRKCFKSTTLGLREKGEHSLKRIFVIWWSI